MDRRRFLKTSAAAAAMPLAHGARAASAATYRPNILMITCHDLGQHLGCYGVETVQSENIDGLAAKGVRFENFYSSSAVCSPGRGSLQTGRYPQSNGLMGLTHSPWWWRLNDDERHTAQILGDLGYATHLIGFNHIHSDPKRLGYQAVHAKSRNAEDVTEAARKLIASARNGDQPFFAKIGFTEVHRPFTHGRDEEKGLFVPPWLQNTEQIRDDLAAYQAEIRFFDRQVGRILDTLEASEIARDTLVIFTSDHGIPYPGAKWSIRRAGFEVPFILHQPGTVFSGGKVHHELISNVDVLPTLLDFLGAPIPENMQGVSFKSLIEGKTKSPPRNEVFAQFTPAMKRDNESRCILTDRYHLIRYFNAGRTVDYPVDVHPQRFAAHVERCQTRGTRPFAQLYDIRSDPYELNDIGTHSEKQDIVHELSQRLLAWMREVNDPLLKGPLRTPYYERAMEDLLR